MKCYAVRATVQLHLARVPSGPGEVLWWAQLTHSQRHKGEKVLQWKSLSLQNLNVNLMARILTTSTTNTWTSRRNWKQCCWCFWACICLNIADVPVNIWQWWHRHACGDKSHSIVSVSSDEHFCTNFTIQPAYKSLYVLLFGLWHLYLHLTLHLSLLLSALFSPLMVPLLLS